MSESEEFSGFRPEESAHQDSRFEPMAVLPANEEKGGGQIEESLDHQSYSLGEVPQSYLCDPQAVLPLNSEKLIGKVNMLERLISEVNALIQDEVVQVQKQQKKITSWEDRIEKNKVILQRNQEQIKKNRVDIAYDKKNRDYWLSRAEQVMLDFEHAEASNREADWQWIIKKYGLKNPNGSQIDHKAHCIEELCQGAASNLSGEYKAAGNKYEQTKKDKEAQNTRMIHENSHLRTDNEQLQLFISTVYTQEIEPLQDGILLLKELGVKLKALSQENGKATYGELRSWAEGFIDEFLQSNPRVSQALVTEFRRLTSTPLPAKNS